MEIRGGNVIKSIFLETVNSENAKGHIIKGIRRKPNRINTKGGSIGYLLNVGTRVSGLFFKTNFREQGSDHRLIDIR